MKEGGMERGRNVRTKKDRIKKVRMKTEVEDGENERL